MLCVPGPAGPPSRPAPTTSTVRKWRPGSEVPVESGSDYRPLAPARARSHGREDGRLCACRDPRRRAVLPSAVTDGQRQGELRHRSREPQPPPCLPAELTPDPGWAESPERGGTRSPIADSRRDPLAHRHLLPLGQPEKIVSIDASLGWSRRGRSPWHPGPFAPPGGCSSPPPRSCVHDRWSSAGCHRPARRSLITVTTCAARHSSQQPSHGRLRGRQHQRPATAADHPAGPQHDERRPPVNRRQPGQIDDDAAGSLRLRQVEQLAEPGGVRDARPPCQRHDSAGPRRGRVPAPARRGLASPYALPEFMSFSDITAQELVLPQRPAAKPATTAATSAASPALPRRIPAGRQRRQFPVARRERVRPVSARARPWRLPSA